MPRKGGHIIKSSLFTVVKVLALLGLTLVVIGILSLVPKGGSPSGSEGYFPPPDDRFTTPTAEAYPRPWPPTPTPVPTVQYKFVGPACAVDRINRFNLPIEPGWIAFTRGGWSITNYDAEHVKVVHGKAELPPDHIHIEIYTNKLEGGQTLEAWLVNFGERMIASELDHIKGAVTPLARITLGRYAGYSFRFTDSAGWDILIIGLHIDDNRFLNISINPPDSPALADALNMLARLDTSGGDTCESGKVPSDA